MGMAMRLRISSSAVVRRSWRTVEGVVLAHRRVALEHPTGELLSHGAVVGVALEAEVAREIEVAVAILVLSREQQALFGLHQLERHLQDHLADIPGVAERAALSM